MAGEEKKVPLGVVGVKGSSARPCLLASALLPSQGQGQQPQLGAGAPNSPLLCTRPRSAVQEVHPHPCQLFWGNAGTPVSCLYGSCQQVNGTLKNRSFVSQRLFPSTLGGTLYLLIPCFCSSYSSLVNLVPSSVSQKNMITFWGAEGVIKAWLQKGKSI